jgi:hypothetical protein
MRVGLPRFVAVVQALTAALLPYRSVTWPYGWQIFPWLRALMKGKLICGSVLGASATLLERCDNVAETFPLFCRSDAGQGLGRPIIRVALFRLPPGDCRDRYSDRGRERCLCHLLIFAERFNQFRCPLHSTAGYLYRVHSFKDIIQHYARMKCTRTMAAKYMG